jgi:hypothetical protein
MRDKIFPTDFDPIMIAACALTPKQIEEMSAEHARTIAKLKPRRIGAPRIYRQRPKNYLTDIWYAEAQELRFDSALIYITYRCNHTYPHQFRLTPRATQKSFDAIAKRLCPICGVDSWIEKKEGTAGFPKSQTAIENIRQGMVEKLFYFG